MGINGTVSTFLPTGMYRNISFSPDGNYVMVSETQRPFSYLVPYYRFPFTETIYAKNGSKVQVVNEVPLDEVRPKGFMATRKGKRNFSWRADKGATLVYAEAQDSGDPEIKVAYRDAVYQLEAPFNGKATQLLKTKNRFSHCIREVTLISTQFLKFH